MLPLKLQRQRQPAAHGPEEGPGGGPELGAHQDAVELSRNKGDPGLIHRLCEQLIMDFQAAKRQLIGADESIE